MSQKKSTVIDAESHHEEDSGCIGCFGCRDKIRNMLAEQREMNKNIPLRLKIVAGVWELLIVLSLLFSVAALSMAAHNSGATTVESVKNNADEYLAQDASHAVITFSADPREKAIQLWNLHNLHNVMQVPVSGKTPGKPMVPGKTPEVPDDVNEAYQNSNASVVS